MEYCSPDNPQPSLMGQYICTTPSDPIILRDLFRSCRLQFAKCPFSSTYLSSIYLVIKTLFSDKLIVFCQFCFFQQCFISPVTRVALFFIVSSGQSRSNFVIRIFADTRSETNRKFKLQFYFKAVLIVSFVLSFDFCSYINIILQYYNSCIIFFLVLLMFNFPYKVYDKLIQIR